MIHVCIWWLVYSNGLPWKAHQNERDVKKMKGTEATCEALFRDLPKSARTLDKQIDDLDYYSTPKYDDLLQLIDQVSQQQHTQFWNS